MPRRSRQCPAGMPVHVVQRGNNRQICFTSDSEIKAYAFGFGEAAIKYGVAIHAWVFMSNHIHLLALRNERFRKEVEHLTGQRQFHLKRGPKPKSASQHSEFYSDFNCYRPLLFPIKCYTAITILGRTMFIVNHQMKLSRVKLRVFLAFFFAFRVVFCDA